ncbi:chromate transporter [Bacillus sp. AGMB 02131]|uniref:Chromate transporter n=1 Tax=Peribacillus faecalis TaxID=2772559 RepID=A0A927CW07_9BACI|nr:chromate transporter [Peribacillus faecalis]MBD3108184.1 chromate transporter [Peribacillus faecalis]
MRPKTSFKSLFEILLVSMKLGLTSFGGPIAHLGYFHNEYVRKRKWLDEKSYADLVALCQFLPGPASSQVGIGIGVIRAGLIGGILSFIGFTLPSVAALMLFASLLQELPLADAGWNHALKLVAVAIVAHAIFGMGQTLTPDLTRKAIALCALVTALLWQSVFTQVVIIIVSAMLGYFLFRQTSEKSETQKKIAISYRFAIICLCLFFGLLIVLPVLKGATTSQWIAMIDSFYRSGSLVFGGGHVVLPLLENEFVRTGLMNEETFLTGYGATQAVPGPLFTFAAYLGTALYGWQGGLMATIFIFLPAFLLIIGVWPFWTSLRNSTKRRGVVMGVNAAVVGILVSAFYQPVWTNTIKGPGDFAFAAILFFMLAYWKLAPWIIVLSSVIIGQLLF